MTSTNSNYFNFSQTIDRPITLDLRKALSNGNTLSTASTNEDDYLVLEDEGRKSLSNKILNKSNPFRSSTVIKSPQVGLKAQQTLDASVSSAAKNRDSFRLSISSSVASSSVPSSISPVGSPRHSSLRPSAKILNSQSSVGSTNSSSSLMSPNNQK